MYMMWRPRRIAEVTPDSLIFLELIKPAPEVLVLGTGSTVQVLPPPVGDYLQRLGVRVEVLDSRNATGYFNVLNDEGRSVVGALLVWDPDARVPETMPEAQEPMWDRASLMQRSSTV
ncbi:NADH dehydrogenase [ubiquinone] 1 alpha subcomplex assembly factor 3 [Tetrabaena socialis]|uniref:NADH dehydrogenase [ubiquinone] 1 alpha subcomplex assembly factor 3 n=1 Tax=Tetrabaena socialis TaxID=47790 RepID=A0A2J8AEG7_9CHLO|nr:NADH dehydrogenase [ubiquinone] 1 alpha subcomplex assembly factor 3 [Tetrabaena socialis]|eukprot:PNH10896.1 NADH dehydrogenase [ubiquinone] 1 alpha subcomplex assembly factor 3 [Tetrabaena socialis]